MTDSNILGVIYSYAYVTSVLIVSFFLSKFTKMQSEFIRKFVHILVSNWWFIYAEYFTDMIYSIIVPVTFIIVNAVATFTNFTDKLRLTERTRNYGLIYFPISLTLLSIFQHYFHVLPKFAVGIGILTMGYGDGLAAIIGIKIGKHKIKLGSLSGNKSYQGSGVMFLTTFCVLISFVKYYHISTLYLAESSFINLVLLWKLIFISLIVTVAEATTPLGLDNISVPLMAAFLSAYML
ncbi:dolichyl monophosphate biosynthetic process [Tritrichomonas musculus]|uniref:Dolichyl monophosphate biosynthetic process n=1 Tax=Tritrichomonas musculus TaxID=1915356 RepID=A0ABR2HJT7_9EUKA